MPDRTDDDVVRRSVDQLPSLIAYWDSDLRNVFANRVYLDYFGVNPADIVGMHIRQVLGEVLYELNLPYITGALAGHQQQFDRTLIDVEGNIRYTQASYVPDVVDDHVLGFTVLVVDVSARVDAERARDRAVRLFQTAMEHAPIGKAILTVDGRWLQVNHALCELTGYTADELLQRTFRDITHPDDLDAADALLASLLDGSTQHVASEKRYIRKDGTTIWVQRNATLVHDADTGDVVIAQIQDITGRKQAEDALALRAVTDDLTGIGNRRRLMDELARATATPADGESGLLFLDIDAFKAVNDTYGHEVGDSILSEVARRIDKDTRDGDLACRIGGDEFVVLVRSARTHRDLERLAARMTALLDGPYHVAGLIVPITVSVGFGWGGGGDLLSTADRSMYRAKRR